MASSLLARIRRIRSGIFVTYTPNSAGDDLAKSTPQENVDSSNPREGPTISSSPLDEGLEKPESLQKEALAGTPSGQEDIANEPCYQKKVMTRTPTPEADAVASIPVPPEEPESLLVSQEEDLATSNPQEEAVTRFLSPADESIASSSPVPKSTTGLTQAEFEDSQQACKVRLPWNWRANGKTSEEYTPQINGKWWSKTPDELKVAHPNKRRDYGHIGRIMETELGEQLVDEQRCLACQTNDEECWIYSARGSQQVSRPGDSCARCRHTARKGGCSLAKRRSNKRRRSSPGLAPRVYRPLKPGGEREFT